MPVWLVARITFYETLRRKDFYVLLILMGLYTLVAEVLLRQAPAGEAVRRTLFSLGLTLSFASAAILAVVLAARQVPREIEQGTILPLLAKPLTRGQFLLGKWLACWLTGMVSLLLFVVLIRLLVPAPAPFGEVLFAQAVVLGVAGLAGLSAMTLMFSLFLPEALNVTLSLAYYFLWGVVFNILQAGLKEVGGGADWVVGRVLWALPHFEAFDLSRLCLMQAAPLPWPTALLLAAYAAAYVTVALTVAFNRFEKQWV